MLADFVFFVSVILLVLPLADWTATIILHRASKKVQTPNLALKERTRMALVLALASTLNGFLASVVIFQLRPGAELFTVILAISLILGSVPNLYWLFLYYSNRFKK